MVTAAVVVAGGVAVFVGARRSTALSASAAPAARGQTRPLTLPEHGTADLLTKRRADRGPIRVAGGGGDRDGGRVRAQERASAMTRPGCGSGTFVSASIWADA
jgi:hypothetical protein